MSVPLKTVVAVASGAGSFKTLVTAVKAASLVETLQGKGLCIRVEDGKVTVNNAKVEKTDVTASNGVIHVIDTVVLPK